jgi:hypothetical protein
LENEVNLPNVAAMFKWVNNFFPGAPTASQDFLQLIRQSDGTILGWIDETGTPHGNIAVPGPQGAQGAPGTSNVPWIDVTNYGMRAIPVDTLPPASTATVNATSTSVSLPGGSSTFRTGDGCVIYGAGATPTLATPSALSVTPSLPQGILGVRRVVAGPAGSTKYSYQIVGRTKLGGITVACTLVSTSTGASTLGQNSVTITSLTRANNVVTVETSAAHGLVKDAIVGILNCSDMSFNGYFRVTGSADDTHFTFNQAIDTRVIGTTTSATGGTAVWFNCNYLSWTGDSNTWQYYIYGRTFGDTLTLIGVTRPPAENGVAAETTWEDYGSPMMDNLSLPDFVPANPPNTVTNEYLPTIITAGGGTTTLTIRDAAINSTVASVIKYDCGQTLLAAAAVANGTETPGLLHIPPAYGSYYLNSHTELSTKYVIQNGTLVLSETLELDVAGWLGAFGGYLIEAPQFTWSAGILTSVGSAYPGWYIHGGGNQFSNVTIIAGNQGLAAMVADYDTFNVVFKDMNFVTGSGGNDYVGTCLALASISQQYFERCLFSSSCPATAGSTLAPAVFTYYAGTGGDYPGNVFLKECYFNKRGWGIDGGEITSNYYIHNSYCQGSVHPVHMFSNTFGILDLNGFINDTGGSGNACVANWGSSLPGSNIKNVPDNLLVTGDPLLGLTVSGYEGTPLGQNVAIFLKQQAQTYLPTYNPISAVVLENNADFQMAAPFHFPAQHTLFWDSPLVTEVAAAASSGGSVPAAHFAYYVFGIGYDGGLSAASLPALVTTTTGNGTVTVTWSLNPIYVGYCVGRIDLDNHGGGLCINGTNLSASTDSFVDTFGSVDNFTYPTGASTGLPSLGPNGIFTQNLILVGGNAPSTSSSPGTAGQIAWDATHIYVCVAANTWLRATLSTF